jgi:thioredoxin 1
MASEKVKTFTDANFGDEVKSGVVQLAEEFNGRLTVAKVDIDENPMTPSKFMVRGIPTLLLFKDGDLKETIVGLETKDRLTQVINKHL